RPRNPDHGDYATNVAMRAARKLGVAPRELAKWLATALAAGEGVDSAEVAGPGFVSLRLAADTHGTVVREVLDHGQAYGHGDELAGQSVNLEFVSANPTGPLHLGHTRWAAAGDALGRLLAARGAKVTREYYFNDAGTQIDNFVGSLVATARGEPIPKGGDPGAYVKEIADEVLRREPGALERPDEVFRRVGVGLMFDAIKASLHQFRTDFDVYTHEQALHDSGAVQAAVQRLKDSGHLFFDD